MLAIWPTQKTGAETPTRATTISSGSKIVPRSKAAAIPTPIASTTQSTAAPKTSDNVAGAAAAISGTTFTPWLEYDSRSRVMKIFFIMMPYSIGNGRLSPSCARISARVCAFGLRPASARAGSTPGVLKKMMNTTTVITNMTSTVHSRRRMIKLSMSFGPCLAGRPLAVHPQLGARVQGVPDAVPEHVQRQHRQQDHEARGDRHPGPGVDQVRAVLDDRSPADVGRLDADAEEGKCRLGQDRGGDHQRHQHDHRGHHVGQDLREDQPRVARPLRGRRLDELLADHR